VLAPRLAKKLRVGSTTTNPWLLVSPPPLEVSLSSASSAVAGGASSAGRTASSMPTPLLFAQLRHRSHLGNTNDRIGQEVEGREECQCRHLWRTRRQATGGHHKRIMGRNCRRAHLQFIEMGVCGMRRRCYADLFVTLLEQVAFVYCFGRDILHGRHSFGPGVRFTRLKDHDHWEWRFPCLPCGAPHKFLVIFAFSCMVFGSGDCVSPLLFMG
jgi:hypothetical protein